MKRLIAIGIIAWTNIAAAASLIPIASIDYATISIDQGWEPEPKGISKNIIIQYAETAHAGSLGKFKDQPYSAVVSVAVVSCTDQKRLIPIIKRYIDKSSDIIGQQINLSINIQNYGDINFENDEIFEKKSIKDVVSKYTCSRIEKSNNKDQSTYVDPTIIPAEIEEIYCQMSYEINGRPLGKQDSIAVFIAKKEAAIFIKKDASLSFSAPLNESEDYIEIPHYIYPNKKSHKNK